MNKELQTKIFAQFPKLFDLENKTAPISAWGIECRDGWYQLVFDLCAELQQYVNDSKCKQIVILQAKEKWSALRVYLGNLPNEIGYAGDLENIIDKYERLSQKTCESCGTSDKKDKVTQNSDGWILTLCEKCRKDRSTIK